MSKTTQYWLVKQEPTAYAWEDFVRDKTTAWTGVRNFQARNNLAAMQKGDAVLFYHSVIGKCVMGTATVNKTSFPDPTADDPRWLSVELKAGKAFKTPVTLENIKTDPALATVPLIRHSRLSVMPLTPEEHARLLELGGL